MSKKRRRGTRYPLLVYRRVFQMWFWPSVLLLIASLALILVESDLLGDWRWAFVPVALISAGLAVYALLARFCFAQAHPHSLRVRVPFFKLLVSYGRVNVIRTAPFKAQFPPASLVWSQRRLAEKLYGHTCTVVELKGFPISKAWLSFWLHHLLISTQVDGLVLLVDDWLQFGNDIESARAEWVNRRLIKREERPVEQILRK